MNMAITFSSCLPLLELLCCQRLKLPLGRTPQVEQSNHLLFFCGWSSQVSAPKVPQARAPRSQPSPWIPAAGVAVKVPGRISRGWATRPISPWTTTQRVCGALTLSRASRRPWPSTHPAADGKSSCPMRGKCMVSQKSLVWLLGQNSNLNLEFTWTRPPFLSVDWTNQMNPNVTSNWLSVAWNALVWIHL